MSSEVGSPATVAPDTRGPASSSLGVHVPGLDGLRGTAALVVLLYHGQISALRGGFLAVSQFFTLSGFLITGILLRNHLGPRGDLRAFWARRIRRLMPAAFLALAGVMLFGATVATHQQAEALPGDVLAAATWTANWRFVLSGQSYINLFAAPSPVQHFWSLAIEEQFYIVLPVALLLLVRRTSSLRVIGGVLAGAALLSTAWMVALYEHGASLDRLYYGTDTRVAELLAGATLAVFVRHTGLDFSERMRRVLATAGVLALAATAWCFFVVRLEDAALWRGGYLLFSLVSCALILAMLCGRGPVAALFSWGPFPPIGRLAYGLYLYHWPIFLWLTEDRTGLSRWPVFVIRMAATFAAAILSYHLLERPIMRGASLGVRGRARFAIAPLVAVAVVVGTVITVDRSATDPLATLHADPASLAMPRVASDGVLDLLVIPDQANDPVIGRLQKVARGDSSVKVTVAEPFACTGGLVATKNGKTCANWARSWPALIKAHNPDAILLYADDWAGTSLGQLTGKPPAQQGAAAAAILAPGFDLLTSRGAPVVWAGTGTDFAGALLRTRLPFNQAMAALKAKRDDIFEIIGTRLPDPATVSHEQYLSLSASTILSDVSLYQRTTGDRLPRVLIVGDSQALSLGYGLDRWAATDKRALVWNHGIEGCGIVVGGTIRTFGSAPSGLDRCRDAVNAWPGQLKAFQPDVVIVMSSLADVQDRKLPGSSRFSSIGDPKFDSFLTKEYERDLATLSSTGARVVWLTAPCTASKTAAGQLTTNSSSRFDLLNSTILPKVFRDKASRVVPFDLAKVLCPGGKPLMSVDGVGELRPDGVHFSVKGALWFARTYGDKLLKLGGL